MNCCSGSETFAPVNGTYIPAGKGSISHKQAVERAEHEFEGYRAKEMKKLESDFDREIKRLMKRTQNKGRKHRKEKRSGRWTAKNFGSLCIDQSMMT